jgi:hypothetical protein
MTPTDKRDEVRLAEGVLGYEVITAQQYRRIRGVPSAETFVEMDGVLYRRDEHGNFVIPWSPRENISDAMMLAEAPPLQNRTLRMVAYPYRRTYATFLTDAELKFGTGWSEANGEHATEEAIALAAIAVIERDRISENQAQKD